MDFGSKFVYLGGGGAEDFEEVKISERDDVALSDSDDCSDDDGETCVLDILDTAGQEEFSSLRDHYVKIGDGFVIIYSITDRKSFEEAEAVFKWLQRLREDKTNAILVANKQDLAGGSDVQVSKQEGEDLAKQLGVPFYETSAKTGSGVQEAMCGLVRIIPRVASDYKIVMLGAGAVGKSSVTLRFVSNTFVDDYDPTIEDSFRKMITVSGLTAVSKNQKKALLKEQKKKRKKGAGPSISPVRGNVRSQMAPRSAGRSRGFIGGMVNSLRNVVMPSQRQNRAEANDLFANNMDVQASSSAPPAPPPPPPVRRVQQKKVDGNVVLIPLRNLGEEPNLVTGDPIKCTKCGAVLTSTGKLEDDGDTKSWTCEFCGEVNRNLDISEDEIPKGESFDYMLSPPTKPKEEEKAEATVETKTTPGVMVYCMDISSSMSANCQVPESHSAWREERTRGEESINSVTRLKCIQKAIERLAEQLKLEQPEKQVLLLVFSSFVEVKGGGRSNDLPRFTDLNSTTFEQLLEIGLNLSNDYPLNTIEQSYDAIDRAVKALRTTGCTALGPALSICTGFVSKVPSSEIILCTDGEPNEGVGSLSGGGRGGGAGAEFYDMIGNYARSKNITINILAMEGASTGLTHVSKAAENSGGTTTKLNPVEIVRQLRLIAQNEVVATSVTVRFFLHPEFVFDEEDFPDNLSQLEKEVGSVKKETDLTFRFKVKDSSKAKEITSVPFQVHIHYTRPDGMQCLRILSKSSGATSSRKDMEENINVSVVGVSAMKTTAKMARAGKAKEAQHLVKNFKRFVDRGAKDSKQKEERLAFKSEVSTWDDHLTDNNLRLQAGQLMDCDADVYDQAYHMNAVQQQSVATKMCAVSKRKMNMKSKQAYYAYHDNM